ncbi:MAG: dephospho-CoA kinase [Gammaproteobacteria bacterium]|nr:MAG: dephospho-CoA kinase [Gammaproteobacteria bacterium]
MHNQYTKQLTQKVLIGLTGGIASGKTTVANYLGQKGAYLIDTDMIARQVVQPGAPTTEKIRNLLGADYLLPDGNLKRGKIKQLIFNDATIKAQYEAIILPAIRQATLAAIQAIPADVCYALLIVPLLFEKGLDGYCDYTISIDIPEPIQIRRSIARNPDDEVVIRQIIAAQLPRQQRNDRADFIVNNHAGLEKLYAQLDHLHTKLCQLPPTKSHHHENIY